MDKDPSPLPAAPRFHTASPKSSHEHGWDLGWSPEWGSDVAEGPGRVPAWSTRTPGAGLAPEGAGAVYRRNTARLTSAMGRGRGRWTSGP